MTNLIIVVDIINGFYNIGNLQNPLMEEIIPNIENLLARKNNERWEIMFLADNHETDDKEFDQFPTHCIAGTSETEVIPQLKQYLKCDMSNYIIKKRYSGFYNTKLEHIIKNLKPSIVIVVGVCTDICVKYTVEELRNRDYKTYVPVDCVTTYHIPDIHDVNEVNAYEIKHMQNILGAKIVQKQSKL